MQFEIDAVQYDVTLPAYVQKVDRFRQGKPAAGQDLFGNLHLLQRRPETELATEAYTPGKGGIYLEKKLGEGSFGVFRYF